MKKILCLLLSLTLVISTSTFMVFAQTTGDETQAISKTTDVKAPPAKPDVKKEENKNQLPEIISLREQLKEFHKDKAKRMEIIKKIVALRHQNNDKSIPVFADGAELTFDVPPVVKYGRTLIPLRAVSNALGAEVQWDQKTLTVTIIKETSTIIIKLGSNIALVNGTEVKIDVPAEQISNRTMVPIRFIAEVFKKKVDWDKDTGSVIIDDEESGESPTSSVTPEVTPEAIPEATPEVTPEVTPAPTPSPETSQEPVVTTVPTAAPESTPPNN